MASWGPLTRALHLVDRRHLLLDHMMRDSFCLRMHGTEAQRSRAFPADFLHVRGSKMLWGLLWVDSLKTTGNRGQSPQFYSNA